MDQQTNRYRNLYNQERLRLCAAILEGPQWYVLHGWNESKGQAISEDPDGKFTSFQPNQIKMLNNPDQVYDFIYENYISRWQMTDQQIEDTLNNIRESLRKLGFNSSDFSQMALERSMNERDEGKEPPKPTDGSEHIEYECLKCSSLYFTKEPVNLERCNLPDPNDPSGKCRGQIEKVSNTDRQAFECPVCTTIHVYPDYLNPAQNCVYCDTPLIKVATLTKSDT